MFCLYKLKEVGLRIYSLSYASNEVSTGVRVSRRGRGVTGFYAFFFGRGVEKSMKTHEIP